MYRDYRITVIIPCLNEEEGIEQILRRMPDYVDEVIVVDNGSTDRTADIAGRLGATVIREHVRGYYERKPDWLVRPLGIDTARAQAEKMEADAYRFYVEAAKRTGDAETRKLLGDLAAAEKSHETMAQRLGAQYAPEDVRQAEAQSERRQFILTYVQPGLAGLMDGDRKSTRLNSSHIQKSRMPSSA